MTTAHMLKSYGVCEPPRAGRAADSLTVRPLNEGDRAEVLSFLAARPVHTVSMAGLIRDNGVESPLNRGTFYGCRNRAGDLEGVALIGHATLLETRNDRALEALAQLAQQCKNKHMIMGERERVEEFWHHYTDGGGQPMRLACRELLFELKHQTEVGEEARGLRPATLDDLELIVPVQAQMALDESGVNPLETDGEGFRRRCARRIEMGRTWVLVEGGRLIFKAEIFADTPEVCYLEGVHVAPERRGEGRGLRCLSNLCATLFRRTQSVCILVNENNEGAHAFYLKAGFEFKSTYDTIFLRQE